MSRAPFARVDRLLALAEREPEFSITSFVAFAGAHPNRRESIDRSFRYELDRGAWVHLQITAVRTSLWRVELHQRLTRAGYETWLEDDAELDARRFLRGSKEQDRELAFLAALGERGDCANWPQREQRGAPIVIRRPDHVGAIERIRGSHFVPTQCWVSGRVETGTIVNGYRVSVSFVECGADARVFAQVSNATSPQEPLPAEMLRLTQGTLAREGYARDNFSSPAPYASGSRRIVVVERVVRESKRIGAVLTEMMAAAPPLP